MKKALYTVIAAALCIMTYSSCKKEYHCECSYNNALVYTKDLGMQVKKNAEDQCTGYDTSVVGESWKCTLY